MKKHLLKASFIGMTLLTTSTILGVENIYEVGGLFGIGTQSPRGKLEIVGNSNPYVSILLVNTNQSASTAFSMTETSSGGSTPFYIERNGSTHPQTPNLTSFVNAGALSFVAGGGTERFRISANGNIGIGTSAPRGKLEISGYDTGYISSHLVNTNTSASTIFTMTETGTGGSTPFYIERNGSTHPQTPNLVSFINMGALSFSAGGIAEKFRIATNGNIGIGISSPVSLLHIKGTGSQYGETFFQAKIESTGAKAGLNIMHSGNGGVIGFANLGQGALSNVFFIANGQGSIGNKGLMMDNEGRVGIGTSQPNTSHLLTVNGGIYATNFVSSTNIQADYVLAKLGMHIGYTDLTEIPDGYTMAVRGKIYAEDFVTNTEVWADDVFEPSYTLMPLSKLRQFVKVKRHLPGVPSEKEALAKEVSLGEMQVILLRKVEELTLYVLELEAEVQKLKKEAAK